jgi:hypothetical protein
MNAFRTALIVLASFGVSATPALADILLYANLTNSQENPPVVPLTAGGQPRPMSFGNATFILNDAMTAMSFTATIFNIDVTGTQTLDTNDNLTAAHIHAGPTVTPTTNGGVVWGFFGNPFNNNNPNDGVVTPFVSGVGGTFSGTWNAPEGNNTTLAAQLDNILNGRSYINFHTTQFGGGEIRGAILSAPDGGTSILLSAIAALGLFGLRRRLKAARGD